LHVAGQHDQVDLACSQQLKLPLLGSCLVFSRHRNFVVGNAVELGVALRVGMIADDGRNFAGELTVALAVQQVDQAVIVLGNENRYTRSIPAEREPPVHGEFFSDGRELRRKILHVESESFQREFCAREIKQRGVAGLVLFDMQEVSVVLKNKVSDGRAQTFAVWALHQQDGFVPQVRSASRDGYSTQLACGNARTLIHAARGRRAQLTHVCASPILIL
jgi:hypothetical protein